MDLRLDPPAGGASNMGADLALLELGRPFLRLYTWDGPWVTLGVSQSPARALLPSCPVSWVRRPTGGRGVLHGHDLTLAGAFPLEFLGLQSEDSKSAFKVYRKVIHPVARALALCGVPACLGEEAASLAGGEGTEDCFAHVAPNDVVDPHTGRKLIGCALKITEGAALLQASIPISPPLVDPAKVFPHPGPPAQPLALEAEDLLEALRASTWG